MVGIIGGSGIYRLEGLKVVEEIRLSTPYGDPSSALIVTEVRGKKVLFLSRHGEGHIYPPHLVPYRANLWALREVGVNRVLAISAVGSINPRFSPGDYVIIDDFLDFTKRRDCTYYEGIRSQKVKGDDKVARLLREGKVVHVDVSEPYCPHMRRVITEVLEERKLSYHPAGTYACTEGPRFETPAEIRAIEKLGGDTVGMTGYPEVLLAKELTMCYASLCVVTNPAAGVVGHRLTSEEVIRLMKKKEEEVKEILLHFIEVLPDTRECNCANALEGAEV